MKRFFAIALLIGVAAAAGGCTVLAVKIMDEVDKAISKVAQSDCELIRVFHGKDVCRERPEAAVVLQQNEGVYCYRRLGGIDCYVDRDPSDQPINREIKPKPLEEKKPPVAGPASPPADDAFRISEAGT